MAADAAHIKGWQIFEVVFGLPFLAAIALHFIVPIALPGGVPRLVWIAAGIIFVLAGVTLVTLTRQEFARYSQPTDPGLATSKLITTGVFSFSQNPLYLGGILFLMGISLAFSLTWGLILLVPSIIACHYILIVPEESILPRNLANSIASIQRASIDGWEEKQRIENRELRIVNRDSLSVNLKL